LKELGIFPRKVDIYKRVEDCFKGYVHRQKEGQRDEHISSKVALPNFSEKSQASVHLSEHQNHLFTMQG
jgi:hypothetical protein